MQTCKTTICKLTYSLSDCAIDLMCRGGVKTLDSVLFDIFDLSAEKSISVEDLTTMLLNLPIEAVILDQTGLPLKPSSYPFIIVQAPANSEGIRCKRKLLAQLKSKASSDLLLQFRIIDPEEAQAISISLIESA